MNDAQLQVAKELTLAVFEKIGSTGRSGESKMEYLTDEICKSFETICDTIKKVSQFNV